MKRPLMASRWKQVFGNAPTPQLCPRWGGEGPMLDGIMQDPLRGPGEPGCSEDAARPAAAMFLRLWNFIQAGRRAVWPHPPLHTSRLRTVTLSSPPRVKARLVALISTSWRGLLADLASRGSLTARCRLLMLHTSAATRPPSLEMGP